jgi:hypothetical protein
MNMYDTEMIATGRLFKSQHNGQQRILKHQTVRLTKMPKLNGPGLKLFVNTKRAMVGIEYAMYSAVTEREKTALIACGPANDSMPRTIEVTATNQTVLTGVLVKLFMR